MASNDAALTGTAAAEPIQGRAKALIILENEDKTAGITIISVLKEGFDAPTV